MNSMSKRQRLEATIAGQAVDRPPVALWRHWPVDDQQGENLARATLAFQRIFDFDFIKVTPSSDYCLAGWGAESRWVGNEEGTREWRRRVIHKPEDWEQLRVLEPKSGLLGEVGRRGREALSTIQTLVGFIDLSREDMSVSLCRVMSSLRRAFLFSISAFKLLYMMELLWALKAWVFSLSSSLCRDCSFVRAA